MNDELKQLVEDAAKLLGYKDFYILNEMAFSRHDQLLLYPLDPEFGDLMKVAEAAKLCIDFDTGYVVWVDGKENSRLEPFTRGDHESLAIAILRAASAVWKARAEEKK